MCGLLFTYIRGYANGIPNLGGTGVPPGTRPATCKRCRGSGMVSTCILPFLDFDPFLTFCSCLCCVERCMRGQSYVSDKCISTNQNLFIGFS